jgi:hypothetical protein
MSRKVGPRGALVAMLVAMVALALPAASQAGKAKPHAATGGASHLRASTALLTGLVFPEGVETSYYFQYGPTATYGTQTPTVVAGSGTAKVPVGQPIAGLVPGTTYHFRIVALAGGATLPGRDKTFLAGGAARTRLAFRLAKPTAPDLFGTPVLLTGTLTGLGNANVPIALQESSYPYLEPFVNIGAPGTTNPAGAFTFRISNLTKSTQFRVVTLGRLQLYSPVITEQVALSVVLRARATKRKGFVRLYGVVSPAGAGARVLFQLQRATRPRGEAETAIRWVTAAGTKLKRGSTTSSRFSAVVEVRKAGSYRAFVKLAKGAYASGASNVVVLRNAAPKPGKHRKRKGSRAQAASARRS